MIRHLLTAFNEAVMYHPSIVYVKLLVGIIGS